MEPIIATTRRHHDSELASCQTVELIVATAPVVSAATSADFRPGTNSHGRLASTMPISRRQRPRNCGRATRCSFSTFGSAMALTSERTARRVRVCMRSPPNAGSDKTAVRRSGSVSTSRCRPSRSWSGSSVRPTTRSQFCSRARCCSRPTAFWTSSEPVVNGSLTTVMSQAAPPSTGRRSVRPRAISVGAAGSATSPTRSGSMRCGYPQWPQRRMVVSRGRGGVDIGGAAVRGRTLALTSIGFAAAGSADQRVALPALVRHANGGLAGGRLSN